MDRIGLTLLLVFALSFSTCGGGNPGASAVLPGSYQIATWKLVGEPVVVKDEAGLYNRIDGGAPKYIERGWVSSTYAEYRKDGTGNSIQAAVHDMEFPASAENIFKNCMPAARKEVSYTDEGDPKGRRLNAVVDLNLAGTYAAYAFGDRFYMELNIDAKTDASLADLKAFVLEMLARAQ